MKSFIVLFVPLLVTICNAQTFPCPAELGACNQCINYSGLTVAVSRNICGSYSRSKCKQIYNGTVGLCADGCNTCTCGGKRVVSIKIACPPYNHIDCTASHGANWACSNGSMCYCTPRGVAFSH